MTKLIGSIALSMIALAGPVFAANETAKIDANRNPTMTAVTADLLREVRRLLVDRETGALLITVSGSGGSVTITGIDFSQTMHGNVNVDKIAPGDNVVGRVITQYPPAGRRTNSLLYSEQLNQTAWNAGGLGLSADVAIGPNGQRTLEGMIPTASDEWHGSYQEITGVANSKAAISFVVQENGYDHFAIQLWDYEGGIATVLYDLGTGTVQEVCSRNELSGADTGSIYVDSSTISPAVGGGYRCKAVFQTGLNTSWGINVYVSDGAALEATDPDICSPVFTGDTVSGIFVGYGTVEIGEEFVGPYFRTLATAVTSGSDYSGSMALHPDATVAVSDVVPGVSNTSLGHTRGTSIAGNKTTVVVAVLRKDTLSVLGEANNTASILWVDEQGRLYTAPSGIDWSQTVHGNLNATLLIDFSQTVHGTVLIGNVADLGAVAWSMTRDGAGVFAGYTVPTSVAITVSTYAVSVGSTATELFPNPLPGASHMLVYNNSTKGVFAGDMNVAVATGVVVPASGGSFELSPVNGNINLYGIVSTGSADVRVARW